jgi:hypothetical protein
MNTEDNLKILEEQKNKSLRYAVISILRNNPNKKMTRADITKIILENKENEKWLNEKYQNSLFKDKETWGKEKFLKYQIGAEIGTIPKILSKYEIKVFSTETPQIFIFESPIESSKKENTKSIEASKNKKEIDSISEADSYPNILKALANDRIYASRIDEKTTTKKGNKEGDNKWSHPDIVGVGFKFLDSKIKSIVNNKDKIELYSYEIKKQAKEDFKIEFFQTVSNSSWANYSYLVYIEIQDDIIKKIRPLCILHKVGLMKLTTDQDNVYKLIEVITAPYKTIDYDYLDMLVEEDKQKDSNALSNKNFTEFFDNIENVLNASKESARRTQLTKFGNAKYITEDES